MRLFIEDAYDWKNSPSFNNIALFVEGENGLVGEDYSSLEGYLNSSKYFELDEYGTVGGGVPEKGKLGYAVWKAPKEGFEIYVEYQWDLVYGRRYVAGEIVKSSITSFKPYKESCIKESNAKMKEVKVLQGYYAGHWDDLEEVDADDTQGVKELRDDLKSYDENERYPHRIITRKVPNPNYDPTKARKSRDHGVMVTVGYGYDGSDKEVYFTEDESIADKIDGMILKSYFSSRDELRQDGYDFIRKNMTKLEKGDYEFKKRYSYYTYFLPDGSKPKTIFSTYIDKRFVKESKPSISIKEGDASKKTNYAVMVYDMNTAHYSLFTGTKARCEQLLSDLDAFESFANDCEDEDEYFAEEEYIMDLLSKYNCIPEIYQGLIDDNSNYSLGLHYGSHSGNMVHIINEDNPVSLYL